MRSLRTYLIF